MSEEEKEESADAEREPEPEQPEAEPEPESEPEPERESGPEPEPEPEPTPVKKAPRGYYVARFMIAPLLASAAIGVHFLVNVPEPEVTQRNHELSHKKKQKKKKKKKQRRNSNQPEPRSESKYEQAWRRYKGIEFEREPVNGTWARPTQGLINHAVVMSRRDAFKGAPEEPQVAVLDTNCRTIRCRFYLRSKFKHEVDLLIATMRRLDTDGAPLWRHFEYEEVPPPKKSLPKDDHYVEVIAVLVGDGVRQQSLRIRPKDP